MVGNWVDILVVVVVKGGCLMGFEGYNVYVCWLWRNMMVDIGVFGGGSCLKSEQ